MLLSIVFIAGLWIRQRFTLQHLVTGVVVCFACPWCSCKGSIGCAWIWNDPDMFVKLWTTRCTLGHDMLDKWVTVCRMKLFFQCSLLDMPRMSLSHHNTLYLKQPLQKATRFIPLRQLELPIGLWNVVVYCVYCWNLDTSAVHVAASCEWCGCLFCLSLMFLQRFGWLRLDLEWSWHVCEVVNHTLHVGSWHVGQVGDSLQDETRFSMFLARHAQDESITSQHPLSEATFAESN